MHLSHSVMICIFEVNLLPVNHCFRFRKKKNTMQMTTVWSIDKIIVSCYWAMATNNSLFWRELMCTSLHLCMVHLFVYYLIYIFVLDLMLELHTEFYLIISWFYYIYYTTYQLYYYYCFTKQLSHIFLINLF